MNPLDILDRWLDGWADARTRRSIHAVIMLVAAVVTIVLAADGDWVEALISIAATLYASSNKANTPPPDNSQKRKKNRKRKAGRDDQEDPGLW